MRKERISDIIGQLNFYNVIFDNYNIIKINQNNTSYYIKCVNNDIQFSDNIKEYNTTCNNFYKNYIKCAELNNNQYIKKYVGKDKRNII